MTPEQLWLRFEPNPKLAARLAQTQLDAKRKQIEKERLAERATKIISISSRKDSA